MRWFKHLTAANRDEKLLRIIDEFDMEGYGAYWLILETISEKITKEMAQKEDIFIELSPKNWRKVVNFSPKKFQKFLSFCETLGLFFTKKDQNLIRVYCPNLLPNAKPAVSLVR